MAGLVSVKRDHDQSAIVTRDLRSNTYDGGVSALRAGNSRNRPESRAHGPRSATLEERPAKGFSFGGDFASGPQSTESPLFMREIDAIPARFAWFTSMISAQTDCCRSRAFPLWLNCRLMITKLFSDCGSRAPKFTQRDTSYHELQEHRMGPPVLFSTIF